MIVKGSKTVHLQAPKQWRNVLVAIAHRARGVLMQPRDGIHYDLPLCDIVIILNMVYANGCRFDVMQLATCSDADLLHDVVGMDEHMNRETGELEGLFAPRCSRHISKHRLLTGNGSGLLF